MPFAARLVIGCALAVCAPLAVARDSDTASTVETKIDAKTDALVAAHIEPLVQGGVVPSITVGVIVDGKRAVYGFGSLPDGSTPDGSTMYEIGSISKGITALLLADAVLRGEVELNTPLSELLPDGVKSPIDYDQPKDERREITLLDLATHRSGLPRLPTNLYADGFDNPYEAYTSDKLISFLNGHELAHAPGEAYAYSNLGFGLLGWLLAREADTSYPQLVANRIATPLGITDLTAELSEEQTARLAPGDRLGAPMAQWGFNALAGCGAIDASADAMLVLAQAMLDAPDGPLGQAIEFAIAPREPIDDTPYRIGLAWQIAADGKTVWHNGQTGGYAAMFMVNKARGIAVTSQASGADSRVDQATNLLMVALLGGRSQPITIARGVDLSDDARARLAGHYHAELVDLDLAIFDLDGQIYGQVTGQDRWVTLLTSESTATCESLGVELSWELPEDGGPAEAVTLKQHGMSFRCVRTE